eukprot:970209_1
MKRKLSNLQRVTSKMRIWTVVLGLLVLQINCAQMGPSEANIDQNNANQPEQVYDQSHNQLGRDIQDQQSEQLVRDAIRDGILPANFEINEAYVPRQEVTYSKHNELSDEFVETLKLAADIDNEEERIITKRYIAKESEKYEFKVPE